MKKERLFSLDVLRGLDMLFLVVISQVLCDLNGISPLPKGLMRQLHHYWGGFTLYDIIMPLFIFMCGAAVPFALGRRLENGKATPKFWQHVAVRVAMLWVLGMVSQGRLLSWNPDQFVYFSNTLQSIAVGYFIAAVVLLIPNRKVQVAIPIGLAVAYALALHFLGDYSVKGNFAMRVDMFFVNRLQPVCGHDTASYTWYFTSLMFGAMTLCGSEATRILTGEGSQKVRCLRLAGLGAALLAVGWALVPWIPMIKHIYTFTFTAQAMGWSCLALAFLYWLTDILKFRRGLGVVTLFGQCALLAYMLGEVFWCVPYSFADMVTKNLKRVCDPTTVCLCHWVVRAGLLAVILYYRRAVRTIKQEK